MKRKLILCILLLAIPIFVLSLGILFQKSRSNIKAEATDYVMSVLNATMQRVIRPLNAVMTATEINSDEILANLTPDSLLTLSHRIVQINSHIDGCSISTEPEVFPQHGRYFSAYSVKEGDSVSTVIEEEYEYFEKIWYKKPKDTHEPCWAVYFDESDSLALTLDGMIASYNKPVYDADNRLLAVISTDVSLLRLSKAISAEKPYPNSFFIMLNEEGRYYIHPDSTQMFYKTIFTDADPYDNSDIITLGHEMTKGRQGSMSVVFDGVPCQVCYMPVYGTTWSLALVCPDSDVLDKYHALVFIITPIIIIGLIIILWFCYKTVAHSIRPLNQLLDKTQAIASGNYEVYIPKSERIDAVGRLQNSFATMLQSLNFHMGSLRYSAEQTERRNEELLQATRLAEEADRNKAAFIQNVTHQIRTPLNIIMGFSQVLRDYAQTDADTSLINQLPEEEAKNITATMRHNAKLLTRLILMLYDSSDNGLYNELNSTKYETVYCNEIGQETIGYIKVYYPDLPILFQTEVSDDFSIQTSHLYLLRSLREVLYNAAKYSDGQNILLHIEQGSNPQSPSIRFIVQDTGPGIPEVDLDLMFEPFTKVDDLSEGLGLGLPLSRRHIQHLGGDLTLDPDYHDGCRFIIELPA